MKDSSTYLETVREVFAKTSSLTLLLKDFEIRPGQQQMAEEVATAFEENKIAFIEAGTGIGKSLAYLIPALIWAESHNECVVISTNTIALQEQLIEKDLPVALQAIGSRIRAVLAKGVRNYVCLRKLGQEMGESSLITTDRQHEELQLIENWSQITTTGSRSELPFLPTQATWDKVNVDLDSCNHNKCPAFKDCFFFSARKALHDAKIIICNHHLLFADLMRRKENENYSETAILPPFSKLIIDEAHHIEDVASNYFAANLSRLELLKIIGHLGSEEKPGPLILCKKRLQGTLLHNQFRTALDVDIPLLRREVIAKANEFFDECLRFTTLFPKSRSEEESLEYKLRLLPAHMGHPFWKEVLLVKSEACVEILTRLAVSLHTLEQSLRTVKEDSYKEMLSGICVDLHGIQLKLSNYIERLKNFFQTPTEAVVRSFELVARGEHVDVRLMAATIDISMHLRESLFDKIGSVVLTSATLTTNKKFNYLQAQVGVDTIAKECPEKVATANFESPFCYKEQALFGVPIDLPLPEDSKYISKLSQAIIDLVRVSKGQTFILFTSYGILRACFKEVQKTLEEEGYTLFKQGDAERKELLSQFKRTTRAVLFGADSFWEGVDVVGDALRQVIITKLPFQVPTEPLVQAKMEMMTKQNKMPFFEYMVPKAVVKFKQAFGRLIRHRFDHGCVICLDTRIITKGYGKQFIESLPECNIIIEPLDRLLREMRQFYMERNGVEPLTSTMPLLRSTN